MAAACIVCAAEKPNYKCPKCLQRYCSLECCKIHKEECTPSSTITSPSSSTAFSTTAAPTVTSGAEAGIEGSSSMPTAKDLIGVDILSKEEKDRLKKSSWLQDTLKSSRLRSQIAEIDKSSDPLKALREIRKVNSEFNVFVHMMLEVLDCNGDNENESATVGDARKRKLK